MSTNLNNNKSSKYVVHNVSLEEKIKIFERFVQTGEKLTGKTIFEGHQIGWWGIQMRSMRKRGKLNITSKQLERLTACKVFERGIESTIDEKIEAVRNWNLKYPEATITRYYKTKPISLAIARILQKYANEKGIDYQELEEEYVRMQKYFSYVLDRDARGKLTQKQKSDAKRSNFKGKFGYPEIVEHESEKYGLTLEKVNYIISKYGSMQDFIQAYKSGNLDSKDYIVMQRNLKNYINVGKNNEFLERLFNGIIGGINENSLINDSKIVLFDSDILSEILETFGVREKEILKQRYASTVEDTLTLQKLADKYNISRSRVVQIQSTCLRALRKPKNLKRYSVNLYNKDDINTIFSDSGLIFYKDIDSNELDTDLNNNILKEIFTRAKEDEKKNTPITELNLPGATVVKLSIYGVETLEQLRNANPKEIAKIKNFGEKRMGHLVEKVSTFLGIPEEQVFYKKDDEKNETNNDSELEQLRRKKLGLSVRVGNLEQQEKAAKELLESYDKLNSKDERDSKEEKE